LQTARSALTASVWLAVLIYSSHLLVANVAAIGYLRSGFLALYGLIWLSEPVRRRQSIALGFLGALVIIRPSWEILDPFYLAALAQAAVNAAGVALSRSIQKNDSALSVLFWPSLAGTVIFGAGSLAGTEWPAFSPWLLGVALFGPLAMYCGNLSLRYTALAVVAPYRYLRLPVTAILGALLFAEIPDMASVAGAVIIVAACLLSPAPPNSPPGRGNRRSFLISCRRPP
jgi:drug/metabolite transporter (DMT)-like permease